MTNWNNPTLSSTYTDVLNDLKSRDDSAIKMMEGTTESNLPTAAKRYNTTSNKFERYDGASWANFPFHTPIDSHIADTAIHSPPPTGSIFMWGTGVAPSGYLICDGSAVDRTTYAALFAIIGTTFGVGDNSTSFNLPNFKGYLPIGVNIAQTEIDAIGEKTGSLNHTHTTADHTHSVASHAHTLSNHAHTVDAHSHTIATHSHSVPGHYHDAAASGATLNITGGGSHSHTFPAKEDGSNGSLANRAQGAASTSGNNVNYTTGTSSSHTHAHSSFSGTVGLTTGGSNGDGSFATADNSTPTSSGSTSLISNGPNTPNTSGTTLTTAGSGTLTSAGANPPVMAINFIIRS